MYHQLLDPLETKMLEELNRMLQGKEADKASIEQAAEIRRLSEEVMGKMQQPAGMKRAVENIPK